MTLKKPSDIFGKKPEDLNIKIVESDNSFRDELVKVENLSDQITQLQQELSQKVIQSDLEELFSSQINNIQENFENLQNDFKKSNKRDIKNFNELKDIVSNTINDVKEEVYNIVGLLSNNLEEYSKELSNIRADVIINEHHINSVNKYFKDGVFSETEKLTSNNLKNNIVRLEKKIDFIRETYSKIEPEVIIREAINQGLLNEPPDTNNSDPLTPLDKNFVTLDQLQQHYRLFLNRIQQQMSTIGGGGETRLKYLDDIVGISTNSSSYDQKFLKYDHSIQKFIFSEVSSSTSGIATYASNAGIATFATSAGIATYASNAGIATYASNTGIATYASNAGIATYTSEWILGANGSSDYTFTGPGLIGAENDPVLYLVRGQQYKFTNTMGMHPFRIQSTVNGSTGSQYNDGITNNDVSNGTLTWNVQFDAPNILYYQCTAHGGMGGKIYIIDAGIATYASNAGIATFATSAGIATYASNAGIATFATSAGIATYASNAGIATYSSNAGIATNAQGLTGTPNLNVGIVTATLFVGNGSGLTNLIGVGAGIVVKDSGTVVGTAGTIDFGDNLTVSAISAGIVTVTGSASGGGSSQFVTTAAGIHTLSNVGIGTTNPTSALTVGAVGSATTNLVVNGFAKIDQIVIKNNSNSYQDNIIMTQHPAGTFTGNRNVAIGDYSFTTPGAAGENVAIGYYALNVLGNNDIYSLHSGNTALGCFSGQSSTYTYRNTLIGYKSGQFITIGDNNTILGAYDGNQNGLDIRTSNNNVVLSDGDGNIRFYANSSGNVGLGTTNPQGTLQVGTGITMYGSTGIISATTFVGSFSGSITDATNLTGGYANASQLNVSGVTTISQGRIQVDGSSNLRFGNLAAGSGSGRNIAIGDQVLYSLSGGQGRNIGIGELSYYDTTSGQYNIGLGIQAGQKITTGNYNVILGGYDGQTGLDIRTSSNNVVIADGQGNIRQYINSSGNVGIKTTVITEALTVAGIVSATSFYGTLNAGQLTGSMPAINGSALIGVVGSGSGVIIQGNGTPVGTAGTINFGSNINVTFASGIATVSGNGLATYANVAGIATYATTAGVSTTSGTATYATNAGVSTTSGTAGYATTAGISSAVSGTININTTGIITASSFSGSGSGLTNLPAGQLTGTLPAIDGSALLNVTAAGTGIAVRDDNASVGSATTVNFGTGLDVTFSSGIATITASGGSLQSRTTVSGVTTSIANLGIGNTNITGFKSYALMKVGLSTTGWLRLYTDSTSRANDAFRSVGEDPAPGSGVIAEVVTTGISTTQIISPFVMGGNLDNSPTTTIYASITNLSGTTQTITANLTILQLEA